MRQLHYNEGVLLTPWHVCLIYLDGAYYLERTYGTAFGVARRLMNTHPYSKVTVTDFDSGTILASTDENDVK